MPKPVAIPAELSNRLWRKSSRRGSRGLAPSAMRMPISGVRSVTNEAMTA